MKLSLRSTFLGALLALGGTSLVVFAQEKTPAPAPAAETPRPAPEAPPALEPAPEAPLRRVDVVEPAAPAPAAEPAPPAPAVERSAADELRERSEEIRERTRARRDEEQARTNERRRQRTGRDVIVPFGNASLPSDERADQVVAIFGNATAEGEVTDAVVAVFGNSKATGPVGDAVVAIFGNASLDNRAKNVVAIFGNVYLGPHADVQQEVVCIFGSISRDPDAKVHHQITNVGQGFTLGHDITTWINTCLFKGRPLAVEHEVRWAWFIALAFLGCYLLIALLFPGSVMRGVETFETRPGYSALAGFCTVVLAPITIVLLCITVIGIVVVPFLGTGLMLATLFGKAVMLAWIGRRFTRLAGGGTFAHPVFAVLIGGLLVMALYTVPVVGLLMFKLLGWLGLGVVVYSLLGSRRDKPAAVAVMPAAAIPLVAVPFTANPPPPAPSSPFTANVPPVAAPVSPLVAAVTLPRAGFWIRLGALALDAVLVFGLCLLLSGMLPRDLRFHPVEGFLLALPIYGAVMWKHRGTTIGGIICSLKVVRLDGREIDWATAIVRALSCFLSLVVGGLGFIWVVIDDDKQSWHDKVAGTTVVRMPKGISLL